MSIHPYDQQSFISVTTNLRSLIVSSMTLDHDVSTYDELWYNNNRYYIVAK